MAKPTTFNEYLADYPEAIQKKLIQMRAAVIKAAPKSEEVISYGIPAYKLHGMLVWFGAHTKHIGLYPRGSGIEQFKDELKGFKCTKGTIQFPLNEPLPIALISKIVKFRVSENLAKSQTQKSIKASR